MSEVMAALEEGNLVEMFGSGKKKPHINMRILTTTRKLRGGGIGEICFIFRNKNMLCQ